ncbi:MAG TPA: hypothetical protein VMQ62_03555, partial [Dongiaceae bacterium]|nr:hypothetical protein [Dongiaceae bacterium]
MTRTGRSTAVAAVVLAALFGAPTILVPATVTAPVKPGAPAPAPKTAAPAPGAKGDSFLDLVAEDPHGRPLHFKDYAGKIRIIDLWATWCGP